MFKEQHTIGITGGIGSGKSYVSDILRKEFGIPIYDCDKEAKRLTAASKEIRRKLIALVGPDVFDGEELNRKCLANFLFASSENASMVNAIIHPAVLLDFKKWANSYKSSYKEEPLCFDTFPHKRELEGKCIIGLESAILFESGFDTAVDYVIFIDAPEDVRFHRAVQRDTATEEQIAVRMKMQRPDFFRRKANYIIDNSTNNDTKLFEQLNEIIHKIVHN